MKKNYSFLKTIIVLLAISTQAAWAQSYCIPNTGSVWDDEIFNVTFGSLNNNSSCTSTGGTGSVLKVYSNYTGVVTAPVVVQGFAYPLSVTVGQCDGYAYGGYVAVWIDYNQNGVFTDPGEQVFMSGYNTWQVAGTTINGGNITIPNTATPGTTRMRVTAMEGSQPTSCTSPYYGEVEDYNIQIITPTPCSGTPGGNAVVSPTAAICPGATAGLNLANTYTVVGMTYQWYSSTTSSVGPYVAVTNGTNSSLTTPTLGTQTWYQAVITCTNSGGSVTATPSLVLVQNTTTNTVPYFEGFEGIASNNKLPNCSWNATNLGTRALTYVVANNQNRVPHNGDKFASFYYTPTGQTDFFSNGIWMDAGITYSATVWYTTDYYSYTNWSLQLLVGSSQSTTGMVPIATASPAASPAYKALTNTFQVPSSGIYYIDIRGTSNSSGYAYYLSWDDLAITIPCSLNSPTLGVTASATTICNGQSVNLTASGATSYTWNTGANTAIINATPNSNYTYIVTGENGTTGCTSTTSQMVTVNPTPEIGIFVDKPTVCAGSPAILTAFGATSYSWNVGGNNQSIIVNPTSTTSYTVSGSNSYNCSSMATTTVNVNSLPTVIVGGPATICSGESAMLTGTGAVTYQWMSNSIFLSSNPVQVNPTTSTAYTVTGTDANGCKGTAIFNLAVDPCTGINEAATLSGLNVYPNPTTGMLTISMNNTSLKSIEITDVTGRVIASNMTADNKVNVDMTQLSAGVYYVKVNSDNHNSVVKVVKQ
jgi:hypothetical protein